MKRRNYTVQLLANGQWHDERSFADLIDATEFAYFLGADRARVVEAAPTAGRRPDARWALAKDRPLSNAAAASLHDKIRARRRPGGRIAPRPRWSRDEPPMFGGWETC